MVDRLRDRRLLAAPALPASALGRLPEQFTNLCQTSIYLKCVSRLTERYRTVSTKGGEIAPKVTEFEQFGTSDNFAIGSASFPAFQSAKSFDFCQQLIHKGHIMNVVQSDGYLRMRAQELGRIPLTHLISSLDDEVVPAANCRDAATMLSGYTEWVSPTEPLLSIGWDWQWRGLPGKAGVVRLGLPRTNILLVSETSVPLPWDHSLEALAHYIDGIDWQDVALGAAFSAQPPATTYKN